MRVLGTLFCRALVKYALLSGNIRLFHEPKAEAACVRRRQACLFADEQAPVEAVLLGFVYFLLKQSIYQSVLF